MPLNDTSIRALKPRDKPYKVADFDGLLLSVKPTGSRLWHFKYRIDGKEKVLLRKQLLDECHLHTILDCPGGTFLGAGVKTVVLFFERGRRSRDIWYYQLTPGRTMGKTSPLNDADLAEFVDLQRTRALGEKSWVVDALALDKATYDLSVKNPHAPEEAPLRSPAQIIQDMLDKDLETAGMLETIRGML